MYNKGSMREKGIWSITWLLVTVLLCSGGMPVHAGAVSGGDAMNMRMRTVSGGEVSTVTGGDSVAVEVPEVASEESVLILPTSLDFIIDPWEVGGHKQVYSTVFSVQNVGEGSGWLTISGITLTPAEESGVHIRTGTDGIRDDSEKNIYMEILCSNGDTLVLSEHEQEYRVFLALGDVFEFEFSGEVNQYASEKWKAKDVSVHMLYSWDAEM